VVARTYGQQSAVVAALELVGERWALLIVRDLLVGPRRYTDLKAGLPRIPTNILSTRLKELQQAGIIRRLPLAHGLGYTLTDSGRELERVILALGRWGFRALSEPANSEDVTNDSLTIDLHSAFHADAARSLPATSYGVQVGDVALIVLVDAGVLTIRRATPSALPPTATDLVVETDDIRCLLTDAPRSGASTVRVLAGDPLLLARFSVTFHSEREPGRPSASSARTPRGTAAARVREVPSHPA
jgi:DNA-binding HxlR family transcriptional regulator